MVIMIAMILNANAYKKSLLTTSRFSSKGLWFAVIAGALMGLFYKFVANAMFSDFTVPETGKLSPYTAVFIFSLGILLINFLFNSLLMRYPINGEKYLTPITLKGHLVPFDRCNLVHRYVRLAFSHLTKPGR